MKNKKIPSSEKQSGNRLSPRTIAFIYAIVGGVWILASDWIVKLISNDPHTITQLQTYKGWFYVVMTALMLYGLIRRYGNRLIYSNRRIVEVLESISDGFFALDEDLVVTYFNKAAELLLGRKSADLLGHKLFQAFPEAKGSVFEEQFARALKEKRFISFETYFGTKPHDNWYDVRVYPLDKGIAVYFQVTTERKRAEQALRESDYLQRAILNNIPDIAWLKDSEGRYIAVNEAFAKSSGRTTGEIVGKTDLDLWPAEAGHKYQADDLRVIQSGLREIIEETFVDGRGKTLWLETIKTPLYNDRGDIVGTAGIARDITERKLAEETIKYQAYHDLLTGLPNRTLFADLLDHEVLEMHRLGKRLAVLFLDVDQFKNINDSFGHAAGDRLIRQIAADLKNSIRELDTIARIGGDEFTLLLPLISRPEDASRIADKVMQTFNKPFIIDHHEVRLTASIGICIYPEDGQESGALLKNADIALHFAKDQGRDNYQFYNSSISHRTLERVIFENSLRQAVERGEMVVHYQPQRNIKTGRITGAEALVRWNHPDLGMLSPAQFIPLAEETGLIIEIDQWVLGTVCKQLKAWEAAGHALPFATANLSARQFQQPALAGMIEEILEKTGLMPGNLGIEITETLAMRDTELTSRNLNLLNAMGVKLLIDDFGTGYSSLSYLKKLPIHKLKIDKSFIADLAGDKDDQAITNAIVAMAHILKLKVVAEGVETKGQESLLESQECDEMQGFLFSKPVTAEEFEELLVSVAAGNGGFDT